MPERTLAASEHNLVWIDLEMTGLLPDSDRIIEIAVVVTDPQVTVRIEGPVLRRAPERRRARRHGQLEQGHARQERADGRVKASAIDEAAAEAQVIAFLKQYVPAGKSPMCGNSICQDRRFLARYMPALEAFFHYRNLDVSTLKELARRWKPAVLDGFKKAQAHTALADIHESIDELLHYRQHLLARSIGTPPRGR
jgi:oligoribonuclease